ncbi:hypothetical protein P153DRAFT_282570 [Dothidotthia symphoricarpi CBS 119687]|uniref:Uncharacterized protein n=1 Tax=Dothidotthia symphoricarpi CBS 119687 TaxID=1392245 RepID=A0A6A6APT4_9PLEO|nr:uncharacterized protein P153DRAFT_282570 [Dothidotthia symphoricarpi CBS 119687]KAF2133546.1 hypothetical protein P153DRAFT_282570 [Dothidotthia symphoricarpi CBS 119687]
MAFEDEDQVDWSDGTLDPPSPKSLDAAPDSTHHNLVAKQDDNDNGSPTYGAMEQFFIPCGLPLTPALINHDHVQSTGSRAQRARIGVHLNRREPSKEDYANFALYQANQKAYEAAFVKNFLAHALHPDKIKECFKALDFEEEVESYMALVAANVNYITNKMIWNAHHRAVNLLVNDGKEGAPFLDMNTFDKSVFAYFGPRSTLPAASKMNESWHRADAQPAMVWFTPKEYPISHHNSPFEDIDDVAHTLLLNESSGNSLPTGRATRLPTTKKRRSQRMSGAAIRDEQRVSSRGNWLSSFPELGVDDERHSLLPITSTDQNIGNEVELTEFANNEPQIISDLRDLRQSDTTQASRSSPGPTPDDTVLIDEITRLEELANLYGNDALNSDRIISFQEPGRVDQPEEVPSWLTQLIYDHKRRVIEKWGLPQQSLRGALPGIRQIVAAAIAQGYRPVADDIDERIEAIEAREQQQLSFLPQPQGQSVSASSAPSPSNSTNTSIRKGKRKSVEETSKRKQIVQPSKKKRKIGTQVVPPEEAAVQPRPRNIVDRSLLQPHPSGSTTLEAHQQFPPNAYFEPKVDDEKPVWRCGIKHAMGYYYNAGDRKNCAGCFTSISENPKLQMMDFYLPSRTHMFQPAPGQLWKPSKLLGKARRSTHLSHNSIAKEAYWAAISAGSDEAGARQIGVHAVEQHLRPKPRKEPTPEPSPEPEPDLGPHPSGSATMEHGQDLPACAYFTKRHRHEERAWRCDVNHALGRYYLAGDKRSCPGCGSNKAGAGRHVEMDFYMPVGVVIRQEAPGLSNWKPRKPYKLTKSKAREREKATAPSHNQICSKKYLELVGAGMLHDEALGCAVRDTDAFLDAKQEDAQRKYEHEQEREGENIRVVGTRGRKDSANTAGNQMGCAGNSRSSRTGPVALVPEKYPNETTDDEKDDEKDDVEEYGQGDDAEDVQSEAVDSSSAEESSSGSDSE